MPPGNATTRSNHENVAGSSSTRHTATFTRQGRKDGQGSLRALRSKSKDGRTGGLSSQTQPMYDSVVVSARKGRRINTRSITERSTQASVSLGPSASGLNSSSKRAIQRQKREERPKGREKGIASTTIVSTPPQEDTLTSRLTYTFKTPPYPDCPICFNSIRPTQHIWSCSPDIDAHNIAPDDQEATQDTSHTWTTSQCCYTPFHLKCIQNWASKSVRDTSEAYRARGLEGRSGEWRCPGCQRQRLEVPEAYRCLPLHNTLPSNRSI